MSNGLLDALEYSDKPVDPAHFWAETGDGFSLVWCPEARGFASMVRFDVADGRLPRFKVVVDNYGVAQQVNLEPKVHLDWSRPYTARDVCPVPVTAAGDSPATALVVTTVAMILFFWTPLLWLLLRWLR